MKKSSTRLFGLLLSIFSAFLLTSCTTKLSEYEKTTPTFNLKQYFNGPVIAWGIVQDYQQKLTRRFCVELNGTWQGDKGLLAEKFYFNDGEISYRNWQLSQTTTDNFTGTAEDVVGIASGKQVGSAFQWQYQLLVPVDGTTYQLTLDDWMYQIDQYRVFNRTTMNKFGITVAEITLFFDKQHPDARCHML